MTPNRHRSFRFDPRRAALGCLVWAALGCIPAPQGAAAFPPAVRQAPAEEAVQQAPAEEAVRQAPAEEAVREATEQVRPVAENAPRKAEVAPPGAVPVEAARAIAREATEFLEVRGRTEPSQTVEIRSRVGGYLAQIRFQAGSLVRAGDILFELDARPVRAELDKVSKEFDLLRNKLRQAQDEQARVERAAAENPAAAVKGAIDKARAATANAAAAVGVAEAGLEAIQLRLEATRITAPFAGVAGRVGVPLGGLVEADKSVLVTIAAEDPLRVRFEIDEATLRKLNAQGAETRPADVRLAIGDGTDFPHVGSLTFVDDVVDAATGTATAHADFPNPLAPNGGRALRSGQEVRLRIPLGKPRPAVLVPDRAVGSDEGRRYVVVIAENGRAEYREVGIGSLQPDGLRAIESGLTAGEAVIVGILPLARAGIRVKPEYPPATDDGKKP